MKTRKAVRKTKVKRRRKTGLKKRNQNKYEEDKLVYFFII
jgi:hypothetical protein